MKSHPVRALERAVQFLGSQAELARRVGKKQAHVWNWINRDKKAPADMVLAIEAATIDDKTGRPRVLRHDLRPDIYPEERAA
jgi:DNA-binding transcriptional regulator YdaS (Cro superfamily)